MKIKVVKPFSYAYDGIRVVHYAPGLHDVPKDCAALAVSEGWAKKHAECKKPARKKVTS